LKSIHLIAPSGASPDPRNPMAGVEWLEQQSIAIGNRQCIERVDQRFAGSDAERLNELNALVQLPSDTVVMAMRGGYGLHRLLPGIDWVGLARAIENGLQICGHSDFTTFQLALLAKTGAVSLSGPMLNYDFGRITEDGDSIPPDAFMWQHFQEAVDGRVLDVSVASPQALLGKHLKAGVTGLLWGGNLTVLASLIGTPYQPHQDQVAGGILFLEDVNEHPYRIERMLMQLLDAGILESQAAILLGGFSAYRLYDSDRGYNLEAALACIRQRLPDAIPLMMGLPFGHQVDKLTLPVGVTASMAYDINGFSLSARW